MRILFFEFIMHTINMHSLTDNSVCSLALSVNVWKRKESWEIQSLNAGLWFPVKVRIMLTITS